MNKDYMKGALEKALKQTPDVVTDVGRIDCICAENGWQVRVFGKDTASGKIYVFADYCAMVKWLAVRADMVAYTPEERGA